MEAEGIGELCRRGGWTYGVLWRIDRRDPRLLVLEESYHEEKNGRIFEKMINQVHVIGQGIIGEVAISGKHRWINFDAQCMESSEISTCVKSAMFKENAEWQHQIFAGIKTVAVISLPPLGVILFGSTQKICESSNFVLQAQHFLRRHGMRELGYDHVDRNFTHPQSTFASVISSLGSYSFKNNTWRGSSCKQRQDHHFSSEHSSLASELLSMGSQTYNQKPQASSAPITSTSSSSFNGFHNLFHGTPSINSAAHKFTNQQGGNCSLYTIKSSSKASPFIPELPENFLPSPQDLNPKNSTLAHSANEPEARNIHDKRLNNDDQVNNGLDCCMAAEFPNSLSERPTVSASSFPERGGIWNENTSHASAHLFSDNDLFDGMEFDLSPMILRQDCWDDIILPITSNNCISELELGSVTGPGKELFSDSNLEQLLDAVVAGNSIVSASSNSVRAKANVCSGQDSRLQLPVELSDAKAGHLHPVADLSPLIRPPPASLPEWSAERTVPGSPRSVPPKLNLLSWIDDSCSSVNAESSAFNQPKKTEESAKAVRKRARPGESARPRPKDRQQIQDRVKELREIVPNSSKCSIDALLDRTIRHLLFLQSVTKYADKLKQVDEPKIIGEESGVVLKDNTNGAIGGATWAYEVAGQTMVCPILIEDLHPSGQMLVEMLCEERGFFLEIADVVRGFGLTILKGVMENHGRKVWARFIVEANRDVTRMDIFMSLVQLLQQTSSVRSCEPRARVVDTPLTTYRQSTAAIPIGLADRLQ